MIATLRRWLGIKSEDEIRKIAEWAILERAAYRARMEMEDLEVRSKQWFVREHCITEPYDTEPVNCPRPEYVQYLNRAIAREIVRRYQKDKGEKL